LNNSLCRCRVIENRKEKVSSITLTILFKCYRIITAFVKIFFHYSESQMLDYFFCLLCNNTKLYECKFLSLQVFFWTLIRVSECSKKGLHFRSFRKLRLRSVRTITKDSKYYVCFIVCHKYNVTSATDSYCIKHVVSCLRNQPFIGDTQFASTMWENFLCYK
jgi:hypothetical protein